MQKLILTGYIGDDIKEHIKETGTWYSCSFAVPMRKTNEDSIWYRLMLRSKAFENLVPYLKKGSHLFVDGLPKDSLYDGKINRTLFVENIEILKSPAPKDDNPKYDQPLKKIDNPEMIPF